MVRDRDGICGHDFRERVQHMGIGEVIIAPRSPWQNPFAERLLGSMRRECLDHVIVLNEAHLRRILADYLAYHHEARTHRSLDRNAPVPREVEPPERGEVIAIPTVGGLHHRYTRAARMAQANAHTDPSERPAGARSPSSARRSIVAVPIPRQSRPCPAPNTPDGVFRRHRLAHRGAPVPRLESQRAAIGLQYRSAHDPESSWQHRVDTPACRTTTFAARADWIGAQTGTSPLKAWGPGAPSLPAGLTGQQSDARVASAWRQRPPSSPLPARRQAAPTVRGCVA